MSVLNQAHFKDETAAYAYVEARVWPKGRICPHCGVVENSSPLRGKSTRVGLYKCYACRKPFTVKIGTIFEASHIPMHIWLQAIALLTSSKKGISANQIHRLLGVTLKSAWFMAHRIREAMAPDGSVSLGGLGKTVEVDETYMGKRKGKPSRKATFVSGFGWDDPIRIQTERKIVSMVERGGSVISFHVDAINIPTIKSLLFKHVDRQSELMTDEHRVYIRPGWQYAAHHAVNHSAEEWVRGWAHTNTIEGYFSIFKRGMRGVYQHCNVRHLHRYLAEFDFRYSNRVAVGVDDTGRMLRTLDRVAGKRLTYDRLIAQ